MRDFELRRVYSKKPVRDGRYLQVTLLLGQAVTTAAS